MEHQATSLAGGALRAETFPLHPATRSAGERGLLAAGAHGIVRGLRDIDPTPAGIQAGSAARGPLTVLVVDIEDELARGEVRDRWTRLLRDAPIHDQVVSHGGVEVAGAEIPFAAAFPSPRQ